MKKTAVIILILGFIISGSFAQQNKNKEGINSDDVYYSTSGKNKKNLKSERSGNAGEEQKELTLTDSAGILITNPDSVSTTLPKSATTYDDYNDYSYSARVKRFHDPNSNAPYFDDAYTNPSNYDSTLSGGTSSPDVNVYVGAGIGSCWGPSFSFGLGWGYDPWYWNYGWGYPYYPGWYWNWNYYWWYYPYPYPYWSPYSYGYWNGYWNGYWDGYYGYPFGWNSWEYPYANTYYGRRRPITSPGGTGVNQRTPAEQTITQSDRNQRTVTPSPSKQQKYQYSRSSKQVLPGQKRTTYPIAQRQQTTPPKYSKPGVQRTLPPNSKAENYASPAYRQPKSSKEYLSPRTQAVPQSGQQQNRSTQPTQNQQRIQQSQKQSVNPPRSTSTRQYSAPNRTNTNPKSYNAPSRTNTHYQSSPPRSNSSASPSRSNGSSYSAPSRSSGNATSSGGGSSGGRRK